MTNYVIRGGEEGKARLRIISNALWPATLNLLNDAGITAGMACLDVGCGGGDVALKMARLVGSSGMVTGIDTDRTKMRLAQQEAEHEAITNAKFLVLGIDHLDHKAAYELVYARLLLTHLSDPLNAVQRMVNATKHGGVAVVEDMDHSASFCYPACPALEQHISLYNQVVRPKGADAEIGPKLPALFRQVGLQDLMSPSWTAKPRLSGPQAQRSNCPASSPQVYRCSDQEGRYVDHLAGARVRAHVSTVRPLSVEGLNAI